MAGAGLPTEGQWGHQIQVTLRIAFWPRQAEACQRRLAGQPGPAMPYVTLPCTSGARRAVRWPWDVPGPNSNRVHGAVLLLDWMVPSLGWLASEWSRCTQLDQERGIWGQSWLGIRTLWRVEVVPKWEPPPKIYLSSSLAQAAVSSFYALGKVWRGSALNN